MTQDYKGSQPPEDGPRPSIGARAPAEDWFGDVDLPPRPTPTPKKQSIKDRLPSFEMSKRVRNTIGALVVTSLVAVGGGSILAGGEGSPVPGADEDTDDDYRTENEEDELAIVTPDNSIRLLPSVDLDAIEEARKPLTLSVERHSLSVKHLVPETFEDIEFEYETDEGWASSFGTCIIDGITVPNQLLEERIEEGRQVDRIFSLDQENEVKEQLANAATIEQAQQILQSSLTEFSVPIVFDKGVVETETSNLELDDYVEFLYKIVDGLGKSPKALMEDSHISEINIINDWKIEVNGLTDDAVGTFNSRTEVLTLARSLDEDTVLHELIHAAHDKACDGDMLADSELKGAFNQAQDLVIAMDVDLMPSAYGNSNEREFFAEMGSDLLNGRFLDKLEDGARFTPEGRALEKLVLERLQVAMPGIDVVSYVQYLDSLNGHMPWDAATGVAEAAQLSALDNTYYRAMETEGAEIFPAVAIVDQDGKIEYIYAMKTPLEDTERFEITIGINPDENYDGYDSIIEKVKEYIDTLAGAHGHGYYEEVGSRADGEDITSIEYVATVNR
ncbi:MAG: hypothetical protein ACI9T8_000116 [Candidatus Saccharimonadales bacterium]|jgi:hypothetical protein